MNLDLQSETQLAAEPGRGNRSPDFASGPPAWRVLLWPATALFVACCMGPYYLTLLRPPADRVNDFFQEWASARNYWRSIPIYTDHAVTLPLYLGLDHSNPKYSLIEVNAHPPTSILLVLPLAFLSYQDAVLVWNATSLGIFAVSLAIIWRGFRIPFSSRSLSRLLITLLVCGPFVMQVSEAQLSMVLLLLITAVWTADRSQRPLTAGALLGLASAIKLFPGFLFFYFIVRREWKSLMAGLLTLALASVATLAVFGFGEFQDYYWGVLPRVAKFRSYWPNASLVGFFVKVFDPLPNMAIEPLWRSPAIARGGIFVSCTLVVGTLAWIIRTARTRIERDLAFSLSLTAMLLVSPITWEHYLLLLSVPITAARSCLPRSLGSKALYATILIAFWSFPVFIQHLFLVDGHKLKVAYPLQTLTILSYQFYALVALFILITVEATRFHDRRDVNRITESMSI